jgi:hypothetical protein
MTELINKLTEFLKPYLVTKELQAKITVNYQSFGDEEEYRKKWESLLAILDPSVIKSRKWNDYGSGRKWEEIEINLDGVKVNLLGAYYDSPRVESGRSIPITQQEQADMILSQTFQTSNLIWALEHGSKEKVDATLAIVAGAAGKTQVSDEIVEKAANRVITIMHMARDLKA